MKASLRAFTGLALAAATGVFAASCSNSSDSQTPAPAPAATVVFNSPAMHQSYLPGDTVRISGSITTPEQMHGYHITIKRSSDNVVLDSLEAHFHGTHTTFAHKWANTLTAHAELEVAVEVMLDHDGNTFTQSCHIHCMP